MNEIQVFKNLSYELGSDIDLVQGAGGNSSIKVNATQMLIKGSGKWMSDSLSEEIFVSVDRQAIMQDLENSSLQELSAYVNVGSIKPSIETLMHVTIPYKYTFHLHCLRSIANICLKNINFEKLNSLPYPNILIEYNAPGADLANKILEGIAESDIPPKIYFLKNHGIILSSNQIDEIEEMLNSLEALFPAQTHMLEHQSDGMDTDILPDEKIQDFCLVKSSSFKKFCLDKSMLQNLSQGILYPDHVVFLGAQIPVFWNDDDAKNQTIKYDYFIVFKRGLYVKQGISKIKFSMILALINLCKFLHKEPYEYISETDLQSLLSREDEIHRINLN